MRVAFGVSDRLLEGFAELLMVPSVVRGLKSSGTGPRLAQFLSQDAQAGQVQSFITIIVALALRPHEQDLNATSVSSP